jgi:hypothetical protein
LDLIELEHVKKIEIFGSPKNVYQPIKVFFPTVYDPNFPVAHLNPATETKSGELDFWKILQPDGTRRRRLKLDQPQSNLSAIV